MMMTLMMIMMTMMMIMIIISVTQSIFKLGPPDFAWNQIDIDDDNDDVDDDDYDDDHVSARGHDKSFIAEVTDQSSGGSRVVPGCGGSSPHPMSNYLEGKILKKDWKSRNANGVTIHAKTNAALYLRSLISQLSDTKNIKVWCILGRTFRDLYFERQQSFLEQILKKLWWKEGISYILQRTVG